jgi:hypothetical protein
MALKIAQQVVRTACSMLAEIICRSASLPKNADGPLPHSTSLPFPTVHAGSCLVDRRAMPPLTTTPSSDGKSRGNGTRKLR